MPILLILALFGAVFGIELFMPSQGLMFLHRTQGRADAAATNFATYEAAVETALAYTSASGTNIGKVGTQLSPTSSAVAAYLPSSYTASGGWGTVIATSVSGETGSVLVVSSVAPANLPTGVSAIALAHSLLSQEEGIVGVGIITNGVLTSPAAQNLGTLSTATSPVWSSVPTQPSISTSEVSASALSGLANNTVVIVREVDPGLQSS